jgi:hypothetical protein
MFEFGRGVKKDYTPAVKYYKAAAEQGHVEAQKKLKSVYEKVNKEYLDAQKAVAQQQMQQMQHHQELQQRFQWQLLQAQHQQLQLQMQQMRQQASSSGLSLQAQHQQLQLQMQQMRQQASSSGLCPAPAPPAASIASAIAGEFHSFCVLHNPPFARDCHAQLIFFFDPTINPLNFLSSSVALFLILHVTAAVCAVNGTFPPLARHLNAGNLAPIFSSFFPNSICPNPTESLHVQSHLSAQQPQELQQRAIAAFQQMQAKAWAASVSSRFPQGSQGSSTPAPPAASKSAGSSVGADADAVSPVPTALPPLQSAGALDGENASAQAAVLLSHLSTSAVSPTSSLPPMDFSASSIPTPPFPVQIQMSPQDYMPPALRAGCLSSLPPPLHR